MNKKAFSLGALIALGIIFFAGVVFYFAIPKPSVPITKDVVPAENRNTVSTTISSSAVVPKLKIKDTQGWTVIVDNYQVFNQGTESEFAEGTITLEKNGYVLNLDYPTQQSSGIEGGRLVEAFSFIRRQIKYDQLLLDCYFTRPVLNPDFAAGNLRLYDITIDTSDSLARDRCEIPSNMGILWFGSYFSPNGGYLFGGPQYQQKAYTLTRRVKTLKDLPMANDPNIKIAQAEAAKIVSSIEY